MSEVDNTGIIPPHQNLDAAPLLQNDERARVERISSDFLKAGMGNDVTFSPQGMYSSLIRFTRKLDERNKVRVLRSIYGLEENVVSDVLNQVAYALRKTGTDDIYTGKAEDMIDHDPEIDEIVNELLENPTIALLTKLCEI